MNYVQKQGKTLIIVFAIIVTVIFSGCKDPEPGGGGGPIEVKPLPKVYINTENSAPITSKEDYVQATFSMDGQNAYADIAETGLRIRGRGNQTWSYPKKPYRLNFDNAISLFGGLPAAKNWALLAEYADATFLFNATMFAVARQMDLPYTNNSFFIELYLNGESQGIYHLTENTKTNVGLADGDILMELDQNNFSPPAGFQFRTSIANLPITMAEPESQEALDKTKEIWGKIEQALFGDDYNTAPAVLDSGWQEFFDMESLMNYLFTYEFTSNWNPGWPNSTYLRYVESDKKIHFGPVWDNDIAYDSYKNIYPELIEYILYPHAWYPTLESRKDAGMDGVKFIYRLFDDPKFYKSYKEYCNNILQKFDVDRFIYKFADSLSAVLKPYADADYAMWHPELEKYASQIDWYKNVFYSKRSAAIKKFLTTTTE